MAQRIVILALTVGFLAFTGCYQISQVTMEEFMAGHHPSEARFHTRDSAAYRVSVGHYQVMRDSLFLNGTQVLPDASERAFSGALPLADISGVGVKKLDRANTQWVIGGIMAVGVVYAIISAMQNVNPLGGNMRLH